MILKEEIEKHLGYCRLQKGLDEKAVKAYRNDLKQFIDGSCNRCILLDLYMGNDIIYL